MSPEMIWDFGDKVERLEVNNSTIRFPLEKRFGLLTKDLDSTDLRLLNSNYVLTEKEVYDLNRASKDSRNYKDRLVNKILYTY